MSPSRNTILLIDDSDDHHLLIETALELGGVDATLQRVASGARGLAYLRREAPHESAPAAGLVLLDINMPGMSGIDVMRAIAEDPRLCTQPVVAFTTSANPRDIEAMYRLRCSSYIIKPVDFDRLVAVLRSLADYWFGTVARPGG